MAMKTGKRLAEEENGGLYAEIREEKAGRGAGVRPGAVFFSLCIPWLEVLLRLADQNITFFGLGLPRAVLAGWAAGLLLWLVGTLIPKKGLSRALTGVLLFLLTAVFLIERCCRAFFGVYFQLSFMTEMTGQVAGDFMTTVLMVIWNNLWFFPLALAPLILFLVFRKVLLPVWERRRGALAAGQLAALILVQLAAVLLCRAGDDLNYYTYDYAVDLEQNET